MEKVIMNQKKMKSIVLIVSMLLSVGITSVPLITAENPSGNLYSVYGYVTLNGNPAPKDVKIILSIPNRADHTNLTTADSRYTVDFDAMQGETANFTVYVYGQYVHPTNTPSFKITDPTPHPYFINLSVNATPTEPGQPGGGGGGGGGDTTTNKAPNADASAGEPYQGYVNQPITFDGSKSSDPDGKIISWNWTFGDGNSGTGETTTHAYTEVGSYMVVLTVTDNKSATDTDQTTADVFVGNIPPAAPTLTGGPGNSGHKNISYDFQAMSTDADNDTIKYIFSWGDEQTITTGFFTSGIAATQSHSWSAAGRYVISVKASDNKTESGTTSIAILIDAQYVGDLGYLIDTNGDGIYDMFYSNNTGMTTPVELQDDGTYFIDSDNIGSWDYIYDPQTKQVTTYPTEQENQMISPLMILGGILGFIAVLFLLILLLTRRKKNKVDESSTKTTGEKQTTKKSGGKPKK
jgi:PKD repeat protein